MPTRYATSPTESIGQPSFPIGIHNAGSSEFGVSLNTLGRFGDRPSSGEVFIEVRVSVAAAA
ncbi:hypothetical protein [Nocardia jiangxiensis]|uniref:hypothetical protein n=1 Tax=Nocardia jiangxiensis TaxID=282685 RepID=UPI0002E8B9F4|nr:hypothetical protein [Nocardia jiangxiensis]